MNETMTAGGPLTLDEAARLIEFLAERGHTDLAFEIVRGVAAEIATQVLREGLGDA
jgi:hypothetical protein